VPLLLTHEKLGNAHEGRGIVLSANRRASAAVRCLRLLAHLEVAMERAIRRRSSGFNTSTGPRTQRGCAAWYSK